MLKSKLLQNLNSEDGDLDFWCIGVSAHRTGYRCISVYRRATVRNMQIAPALNFALFRQALRRLTPFLVSVGFSRPN